MMSLVIDTCTSNVVIGLVDGIKVIDQTIEVNDQNLSGKFISMVENLFSRNSIDPQDIDTIFVAVGPGSFTGIRIGVAFAKVTSWALNKKVVPFSSLELMCTTKVEGDVVVPLIDARRGYVFGGVYDSDLNALVSDSYIKLDDLKAKLKDYGEVSYVSLDEFEFNTVKPNVDIASLVAKHLEDNGVNPHTLNPNYLKKTEAEEKLVGE